MTERRGEAEIKGERGGGDVIVYYQKVIIIITIIIIIHVHGLEVMYKFMYAGAGWLN